MSIPKTEQLAAIAAQLTPRNAENIEQAANDAAKLWEYCERIVGEWDQRLKEADKDRKELQQLEEAARAIDASSIVSNQSKSAFDQMLRELMPELSSADRMARFREFLAESQVGDKLKAGELIAAYKNLKSIPGLTGASIKTTFKEWWNRRLSDTRRAARRSSRVSNAKRKT